MITTLIILRIVLLFVKKEKRVHVGLHIKTRLTHFFNHAHLSQFSHTHIS